MPTFSLQRRRWLWSTHPRRRFRGLILFGCCAVATVSCGGNPQGNMPPFGSGLPTVPATPEVRSLEHRMSELVNRDRKKNQLPPLTYDERLADAARSHSADMQKNRFFEHESPTYGKLEQRLNRAGYVYLTSRENLAEAPDINEAEEGLLRSPHHYENIMATDITSIGIGIVKGGPSGDPRNLAVTQIFATPGKAESEAEASRAITSMVQSQRSKQGLRDLPRLPKLDAIAERHLGNLQQDLSESNLKPIAKAVATELAQNPIPKIARMSVGGQVVVDSTQFQAQGALLEGTAKGFGMAVRYGKDATGARRLRVLFLVGL